MSEFGGFWKTHRYRMRNTVNMYFYNNEVGRLKSETKTNEKRKNRKKTTGPGDKQPRIMTSAKKEKNHNKKVHRMTWIQLPLFTMKNSHCLAG